MNQLNPLLGKIKFPGQVFQLPSKGLFYQKGGAGQVLSETSKDSAEIEVKPMSALTEMKVRSADLLYSNKILNDICSECIPDILRPGDLLSRDVDALFVFLVASTYGPNKTINTKHNCEKAEWHDYIIDLNQIIANPNNRILDHIDVLFNCELPNNQSVKLKPVTFSNAVILMNLRAEAAKKESEGVPITSQEIENILISDLLATIEYVLDGTGEDAVKVVDPKMIGEWIRLLPKKYIDLIVKAAGDSAGWGFDFNTKLTCRDCKKLFDFELDVNPINFFTG